ncbi:hypothetical protein EG68_04551 [Paragonimus skrjabini miyazakii]|uniref:Uncharacterized protein n=1 Tax=Paragonimus skrjabini miyazakii TaxID=59628 RepID=A0A8S9YYE5_9TREM|nr:hypothetical protein EG68_04551 [Paragonimus skrjabini miyazakii]
MWKTVDAIAKTHTIHFPHSTRQFMPSLLFAADLVCQAQQTKQTVFTVCCKYPQYGPETLVFFIYHFHA